MLPDGTPGGSTLAVLKTVAVVAAFLLSSIAFGAVLSKGSQVDDAATAATAAQRGVEQARIAVDAQRANTERTECFRGISASLDEARWDLIASLITVGDRAHVRVIGEQIRDLPNVVELADRGGFVNGERISPCPPPPAGVTSGDHNRPKGSP